ncbi:MAG TPA: HAMP domain-containing sensor histidine kinase [Phototrophicaceae bacterium]|nr:HAMP domain-containing sensor histidine kinase [Phototrophicaceae bacterium]
MEIEYGVTPAETIVFSDYHDAYKKETELIKKAKKEIQILCSTANAFHIQKKGGLLRLLMEMAEQNENLRISILSPIDTSTKESADLKLLKRHGQNILVQDIAPSISIKIMSLVVDRKESLIMELKHVKGDKSPATIGFSFYSNSESTVLSYASIFEVLYNQSILFDQLKQEDNVKNEFINIAAHELRTPIIPILIGMEILEQKLGDNVNEYRQEIDIIARNASRLQNLAESILQVSRIESGTFNLTIKSNVDIHSLIAQVIEDVEKKYAYTDKARKISIVFLPLSDVKKLKKVRSDDDDCIVDDDAVDDWNKNNISNTNTTKAESDAACFKDTNQQQNQNENEQATKENAQNSNGPLHVDCDSQKIAQVIFNLLDNAMKFTFDGKVFVSTAIASPIPTTAFSNHPSADNENASTASKENTINENKSHDEMESNNGILVTVQDTGIGIDSQIKNHLFEKFATKSRQGTGLGLYLSKKIIESHGGKMWYEETADYYDNGDDASERGNSKKTGTVFKFIIPMTANK